MAQIARLKGAARVIGSAGSAEKVALLTERYGYDAAFNYKDSPVLEQLQRTAPYGIDLYYNNVENPPGPRNLHRLVTRRLQLKGFVVCDHEDLYEQFIQEMSAWVSNGDVVYNETVIDGIENAPDAFLSLMQGDNTGKMVVRCL